MDKKMMRQNHPEAPVEVAVVLTKPQQVYFEKLVDVNFDYEDKITWSLRKMQDQKKLYIFDETVFELIEPLLEEAMR
jgi:hypothetical protein